MLEELAKILTRPRIARRLERVGFTAEDREAFVDSLRELSEVVPVTGEVKLCRDPNDDAIMA